MSNTIYRYHWERNALKSMALSGLHFINCVSKRSFFHAAVREMTGGPAGHTQILVPEILPNGEHADSVFVVEALLHGVQKNRMSETIRRYDYVIIYQVEAHIPIVRLQDLSKAYDTILSLVNKKYDVPQLAAIAAAVGLKKIFGEKLVQKWFVNKNNPFRHLYNQQTKDRLICSEVASIAAAAYGARSSWPIGLPLGFIDPNRLTEVFKLTEVMRLKA